VKNALNCSRSAAAFSQLLESQAGYGVSCSPNELAGQQGPLILPPQLYEHRVSPVRALSVVTSSLALHTGHMASDGRATTFDTGADGFIGTELVTVLTAHGHQLFGHTESVEAAERVRCAGAVRVMGDLFEPGQWQDVAATDWVFHLPTYSEGSRVTWRRTESIARVRVLMMRTCSTRWREARRGRLCASRTRATTERRGRVQSLKMNRPSPLPGNAASRPRSIASTDTSSPACRSSLRSAGVSTATPRGFVNALSSLSWRAAVCCSVGRPGHGCRPFASRTVPARWCISPSTATLASRYFLADLIQADVVFANIRLRASGFRFRHPTLDKGPRQILGAIHE
jgi:hypothetical protein